MKDFYIEVETNCSIKIGHYIEANDAMEARRMLQDEIDSSDYMLEDLVKGGFDYGDFSHSIIEIKETR